MPRINSNKKKIGKYLLPYDIYERHKKVGSFIEDSDVVLDVGGELNQLSQFSSPKDILVANLQQSQEKSDVVIKEDKLPFKTGSYSTLCAIDVLEHIPANSRKKFITELLRVASKKVILSFPVGTKSHTEYEKQIEKWLKKRGHDVTYLKEHIEYGLPTRDEIITITKDQNVQIHYSGDLMFNNFLFKLYMLDPQIKFVRKIVYLGKLLFNFLTNPILYLLLSKKNYSENVVRAYMVILQ